MAKISKRDYFGNPVLDSVKYGTDNLDLMTFISDAMLSAVFDTDGHRQSFVDAFMGLWHNYGIGEDPYTEWTDDTDKDATTCASVWGKSLTYLVCNLWGRYKPIIEAYETKIDWLSGIVNETTYNDVKDVNEGTNEATSYALPNKSVSKPYGTPTGHNEGSTANTSTKSGSVTTKGMLNPVSQRDLYVTLMRNAWVDMARECEPLFCTIHA